MRNKFRLQLDYVLLAIVIFLVFLGILMVFSSSAIMAESVYKSSFFFLKRQVVWAFLGFSAMFFTSRFKYIHYSQFSFLLVVISFILLVLVLIPGIGTQVGGAKRWLRLGPVGFQPSEFAKLSLIIYTASWLDRKQSKTKKNINVYLPKIFIVSFVLIFILIEPDLGNTLLLFIVILSMHFVAGLRLKYLLNTFLLFIPALYFMIFNSNYRKRRILSYLNPWQDPQGSGYQIIQSLLALGSGGLTGVGIGESKLKLLYLPDAHTDFIYPIIGEELGVLATVGVIIAFAIFFFCGMKVALQTKDMFGKLLCYGFVSLTTYQAIINIAVATASVPTKGMPLPFISFGGSSLFVNLVCVGIVLNIYNKNKKRKKKK